MFACMQPALFFLFFIILQASAQNYFKPSVTCYMKYEHEETISQTLNTLLHYSYHESEVTQYVTAEGEQCATVDCACFSYRSVCSYPAIASHHYSQCTDADQQNGIVKWYRGIASHAKCEQMRQQPQIYLDLTCCYTDRCNNQPAKITKISDTELPSQMYSSYNHQGPQPLPMSQNPPQRPDSHVYHPVTARLPETYKSSQQYDSRVYQPVTARLPETYKPSQRYDSHVHHPTASRSSYTYKPSETYERPSQLNNSSSFSSFSISMVFFTLLFCLLVRV
jgi:hypothetical protein